MGKCNDPMPASAGAGHWRDWHRGHGCELDPDANATPPPAQGDDCRGDIKQPYASHQWVTVGSNIVCATCDVLQHTAPKPHAQGATPSAALSDEARAQLVADEFIRSHPVIADTYDRAEATRDLQDVIATLARTIRDDALTEGRAEGRRLERERLFHRVRNFARDYQRSADEINSGMDAMAAEIARRLFPEAFTAPPDAGEQ